MELSSAAPYHRIPMLLFGLAVVLGSNFWHLYLDLRPMVRCKRLPHRFHSSVSSGTDSFQFSQLGLMNLH